MYKTQAVWQKRVVHLLVLVVMPLLVPIIKEKRRRKRMNGMRSRRSKIQGVKIEKFVV